jgi:hypothetical protein
MHAIHQWRYRAKRRGLRLVKYQQGLPGHAQYGPYALLDAATNRILAKRLEPADVERLLYGDAENDLLSSTHRHGGHGPLQGAAHESRAIEAD